MEPVLPLILIVIANFVLYWVFWGSKKYLNTHDFLNQNVPSEENKEIKQKLIRGVKDNGKNHSR